MRIDVALQSSKKTIFLGHYGNTGADTPYSLSQTADSVMLYQKRLLFTGGAYRKKIIPIHS